METEGMEIGGLQFVWLCVKLDKYQIEFFIKETEYGLESIKEDFRLPLASGEELRAVNFESVSCVALSTSDLVFVFHLSCSAFWLTHLKGIFKS